LELHRPRFPELSGEDLSILLKRVSTQDQTAFGQLFQAYYSRVANFLRVKLPGQDDAIHSIANEVLYEIWRKPGSFDGSSRFSTFLIGIAKNKLLQHWGRQDDRLVPLLDDEGEGEDEAPGADAPGSSESPYDALLNQQELNVLRDCADKRLNPLQRTVLLDRLLYGYKIEEIAQTLERNAVTLRRAFQIAYEKVMACVHGRLGLKPAQEVS
jgi:RNA polymerase sigma-70 factor (ECF subfamily)